MQYDNITRQHILDAVAKIEHEKPTLNPSIDYDVIINDRSYPPKEVMRYANLLANGTMAWDHSGGEPTHKFLTKHGFDVLDKRDDSESKNNLIQLFKKAGRENIQLFFTCAESIVKDLGIPLNDERITYGTLGNQRMAITIGQRYCLYLDPGNKFPWFIIQPKPESSTDLIMVEKFSGNPENYYFQCKSRKDVESRIEGLIKSSEIELNRTSQSGFRRYNKLTLERCVHDVDFRNALIDQAMINSDTLTGRVWKQGCNWGANQSYYDYIKNHSIAIGNDEKKCIYEPGDLVLISIKHGTLAIARVETASRPVTTRPEWQSDLETYGIPFQNFVTFADAEWYELAPEDRFKNNIDPGFSQVRKEETKRKALELWNERNTNYWIFQGNPSDFDFERAVRNNKLHDWTVTAHKDKIKPGDKVILWLSGKQPGCYALAQVTSEPAEFNSEDDVYWKTTPKQGLKAGIKITHNLLDRPLLLQDIKNNPELKDLKVGNQGTNFSATRQQYTTLLNLMNNNGNVMSDTIDLFVNTILYGPPGTGKTYTLKTYQDKHFTDQNISKSSEEVLREKLSAYPFWKVLGAVVGNTNKALSVSEIVEHPLVKAWVKPSVKTKSSSLAWGTLQSFATDESTQMDGKYRRSIKLFSKDKDSRWSIADDKRAELPIIIDQDLLDLAADPKVTAIPGTAYVERFNFITFHQKYSYEDFIEGIKPVLRKDQEDEPDGRDLQFELKRGIFYESCLQALNLAGYASFKECYEDGKDNRAARFNGIKGIKSKQFALFIDEINRANISAVFGELITLLEDDKRIGTAHEMWPELPYSNEKFCVPPNLYVIGTMNTADRSIAMLDIALRRRFEFEPMYPEYEIDGLEQWSSTLLKKLNEAIYQLKKSPDFFIGHAFFINKPEDTRADILNKKIIPLLAEYCQNNLQQVRDILTKADVVFQEPGIHNNFQIKVK